VANRDDCFASLLRSSEHHDDEPCPGTAQGREPGRVDLWMDGYQDLRTPRRRCDVPPCRLCPGLTGGWWLLVLCPAALHACVCLLVVQSNPGLLQGRLHCLLRAWPCCCTLGQRSTCMSIAEAPGRPRSVPLASRSGASACVIREQIALYEQCYAGKGKRGRSRCGAAWRPSRRHRSRPGARGQ